MSINRIQFVVSPDVPEPQPAPRPVAPVQPDCPETKPRLHQPRRKTRKLAAGDRRQAIV